MMIDSLLITMLALHGVSGLKDGHQSAVGEFPYIVTIQYLRTHLCSGTIIDENHILTVGHPIAFNTASELVIMAGMVVVRYPWFRGTSVKNIYFHPDFVPIFPASGTNDFHWDNDIAILRLTESLLWSPAIAPVPLSSNVVESYSCFECSVISWSYCEGNSKCVLSLWDFVQIMDNDTCIQWDIKVLRNQQCFVDFFETALIGPEDLGSPIICGQRMIGFIVEQGQTGVAGSPSTFLFTLNYSEFITEIINDGQLDVKPFEFPYVVSIWYSNKYVCAGSIIDDSHVVTSGHCVRGDRGLYTRSTFRISAGSTEVSLFDQTIQWFEISDIQVHPHFKFHNHRPTSDWWIDHDIAILTLTKPILWRPTISPLQLAYSESFSTEQYCEVLHWKRETKAANGELRRLQKSTAILIDISTPDAYLRQWQFAARNPYNMHTADPKESGNPIVCGGYPLGIMVKVESPDEHSKFERMIFLHIRPYYDVGFFHENLDPQTSIRY